MDLGIALVTSDSEVFWEWFGRPIVGYAIRLRVYLFDTISAMKSYAYRVIKP